MLLGLVLGALAIYAAVACSLPLLADEAYYQSWSLQPGLGYFDHPPGIAWWIAASAGHPRLLGVLGVLAGALMLARAGRSLGIDRAALVVPLVLSTPLGLAAAVISTPDTPLFVAWCGVIWAVAADRPVVAGALFGACMWAKSTALFGLPGLMWVLGARGPLALCVAALIYLPHVVWSLDHDGLPWAFQLSRGLGGFSLHEAVLGQLLVATPVLAALAVDAWRSPRDATDRMLRAMGLPILLTWLGLSLLTRVEANWPALAWPATALLVVRRRHRLLPVGQGVAVVITLIAAILGVVASHVLPISEGPVRDPEALAACYGSDHPLIAARYQEKALLDLAGEPVGYLRAIGHRESEYDRESKTPDDSCDFLYLAGEDGLAGRCSGRTETLLRCGRRVTLCNCP